MRNQALWNELKGCTRKIKYLTREEAELSAREQDEIFGRRHFYYQCLYCSSYHITVPKKEK